MARERSRTYNPSRPNLTARRIAAALGKHLWHTGAYPLRPDPDALRSAERRCFMRTRAALGSMTPYQWVPGSSPGAPSPPKLATDSPSPLAERPFLRPFLARGGLRYPVSARRHRLQDPFSGSVSGRKNPVPNSSRAGNMVALAALPPALPARQHCRLKPQRGCGTMRMYGLGAFQPFG